jgi:hypothetical protein
MARSRKRKRRIADLKKSFSIQPNRSEWGSPAERKGVMGDRMKGLKMGIKN